MEMPIYQDQIKYVVLYLRLSFEKKCHGIVSRKKNESVNNFLLDGPGKSLESKLSFRKKNSRNTQLLKEKLQKFRQKLQKLDPL